MNNPRVFDYQHYELLNRARGRVVRELLDQLSQSLRLRTAVDVGCGLGYFSEMLNSLGLQVVGADGRKENAEEASRRVPTVNFHTMNAEDIEIRSLGIFDLCFCFGLLYHLENPFIAIRHLHAMTRSLLLVEGLIYPGDEPIMGLVEETPFEDQGLRHYAFYPTEACLVKMMYLAGFANVYRIAKAPDHPGYSRRGEAPKKRTILAASHEPLTCSLLVRVAEPASAIKPWVEPQENKTTTSKLRVFATKPLPQKVESIKRFVRGK